MGMEEYARKKYSEYEKVLNEEKRNKEDIEK